MSQTITIKNLKSIKKLEFTMPKPGVYVLTGVNGAGKTSLMACLERLHTSRAFQNHFKTSVNHRFDSFRESEISYSINQNTVTYRYTNSRWVPTPKDGSNLLKNFGYSEVIHITSNGDRFYIQDKEISQRDIRPASKFIIETMCELFQSDRFRSLKKTLMSNKKSEAIRRSVAYILPIENIGQNVTYYSEKNFSLGEILLLNALHSLDEVNVGSLVLIDEVELALHPKVQVNFFRLLKQIADQKNLTIIISTHSSSLIKAASGNLIFLQKSLQNGEVEVFLNCSPTLPLQNVSFEEDISPDYVFFVEDDNAKIILEEMIKKNFSDTEIRRPITRVYPIGGWRETILFLKNACSGLLAPSINSFVVLDEDVKSDISALLVNPNLNERDLIIRSFIRANINKIKYLPITPELGIVEMLRSNTFDHIPKLQYFFNAGFDISQILIEENSRGLDYPANPRSAAKIRIKYYKDRISSSTGKNTDQVYVGLSQYYVDHYFQNNYDEFRALLNPIFR